MTAGAERDHIANRGADAPDAEAWVMECVECGHRGEIGHEERGRQLVYLHNKAEHGGETVATVRRAE
jgi:hypothetical protein